jgi:hypothetical protein
MIPAKSYASRFPALIALIALIALMVIPNLAHAQNLESELRKLQEKQQQELLDMQKKIEAQKVAKPGDPNFYKTKVSELEAKLAVYENPVQVDKSKRPAMQKNIAKEHRLRVDSDVRHYGLLHAGGICLPRNGLCASEEHHQLRHEGASGFLQLLHHVSALRLHLDVRTILRRLHRIS